MDRAPAPSSVDATRERRRTLNVLPPVLLIAAVLMAFAPAFHADFISYDDVGTIIDNPNYRGFSAANLRWMFTTDHMGHYQPLAWITFAIDHAVWGMDPRGYHIASVVIHAINAVLVFFLARWLLQLAGRGSPTPVHPMADELAVNAAASLAALLFAVHPMRVESVVWVTERRDVLSGCFALLTTLAYLKSASGGRRSRAWLFAGLACFALALFSKAIVVVLPGVLLALDVFPLRRLGGDAGWFTPAARRVMIEKIPFAALACVFVVIILRIQSTMIAPVDVYPLSSRLIQAMYGLSYYPRAWVWPTALLPIYELPIPLRASEARFAMSIATSLVGLTAALAASRRWPAVLPALACYVFFLLPVLGFFQTGEQLVADRYSYLSCIGWAILAGGAALAAWRRRPTGRTAMVVILPCALAVLWLGVSTVRLSRVWQSSISLWQHTIAHDPNNAIALTSLAAMQSQAGDLDGAIAHLRKALRMKPGFVEASLNLARALHLQGNIDLAITTLEEALRFNPGTIEAHQRLGDFLLQQQQFERAVKHFQIVLAVDDERAAVHHNLAMALAAMGDGEAAISHAGRAVELQPDRAGLHTTLAAYLWQHRHDGSGALRHLESALRLQPGNAKAVALRNHIKQALR